MDKQEEPAYAEAEGQQSDGRCYFLIPHTTIAANKTLDGRAGRMLSGLAKLTIHMCNDSYSKRELYFQ